jgi:hypothetical protein
MQWPQYVSAEGQWYPCWFASHVHREWKKDFWVVNREKFDLNKRTLDEIFADPVLKELEDAWASGEPSRIPFKCARFCSAVERV